MTFPVRRTAAAAVAAVAWIGLTACNGSGHPASAASTSVSVAAAGTASSSPGPTAAGTAATATAGAAVPSAASASVAASVAVSVSASAAAPTTAGASHAAAVATPASCQNLSVPSGVKSAVVQTWANAKGIAHIQPRPGGFYYGSCGTTLYAAARFEAGPGATSRDLVQLQDEGTVLQFFRFTPSAGWAFVGSDSYPPTGDCAAFAPAALARQWHCS